MPRKFTAPGAVLAPAAAMLILTACASAPPPNAQLAVSATAIDHAQSAGAPQYAPVDLRSAREHLARAEEAVREGRNDEARRYAEAAEVDARLAETRAHAAKSQLAARELRASIEALRQELARSPRQPG